VASGKIYVVYRDFPLPMHRYSRQAASYACAAAHLGLYQPVAEALFKNQPSWSQSGKVWESVASVLTASQQKKVETLASSPEVAAEIQRETNMGQREQISSTPTLIVTHGSRRYPVSGTMPYALLRKLFDDVAK
jgi:protein-disulfide isomerase